MTAPVLRPYQEQAIADARAAFRGGSQAVLVVSPTGAGKTTIGATIAARHLASGGTGVLWLAHRKELVEQAADRLEEFGLTVGVIAAGTRRCSPHARTQVASIQTLRRRELPTASLVIPDEAHHFAESNDWTELLRACRSRGARLVGLTATPERGDGQGLGEVFDSLVTAGSIRELTEFGHLVPCDVMDPGRILRSGEIAQSPVDAYLEHARGRRAVVFSPHVKAARQHLDEFLAAGVRAGLVHGQLEHVERSDILRRYRAGELDVLVNVYVLTEGWDDPLTSCCILARGCGTPGMYLQMVGRILRPAPGKANALLLDLRGVVHVHGRPDEERSYSLDGTAIRRTDEVEARLCQVCGAVLEQSGPCPDCGRAPSELEAPKVVGISLEKFVAKRRETDEERAATLARWLILARSKTWKEGWALHKYKVVYGDWPSRSVKQNAAERARGAA